MRLSYWLLVLAMLLAWSMPSSPVVAAAGPAGHWEGKIQIPDREMTFAVDLAQNASGAWIGSLSIHGADVPLAEIAVKDAAVRFTASLPASTTFEGTLSADAAALTGKVGNAEGAVPFTLARSGDPDVKLPPPSSRMSKAFEGAWEGTADRVGKPMRVALTLSAAPDGTARATLVSIDKGNLEIPVTTVIVENTALELQARVIGGT
ncbi:MAG TPA: hypothetical protein VKH34_17145, partial [Vicinamibacterales bacterium]|nr:hypothetical protein [Vicinamibacterales bacterium]